MFLASFSLFFFPIPFQRKEGLKEILKIRSLEGFHSLTVKGKGGTESRVGCLEFLQCWALPGLQTEHWEAPFSVLNMGLKQNFPSPNA